jgi:hypothetical protein
MPRSLRRLLVGALSVCLVALPGCRDEAPNPLEQIASDQVPAAANGLDQVSAEEALETVLSALASTESYHVTGTSTSGEAIDIFFVDAGATGTVGSGKPVTLVAIDGRIYVTGDAEFLATNVGADAAERRPANGCFCHRTRPPTSRSSPTARPSPRRCSAQGEPLR